MDQVSVINIDDPAGKTVGRRQRPVNPLAVTDGLQRFINDQLKETGYRLPPRGVYRFHSYEEADEWMAKLTGPIES